MADSRFCRVCGAPMAAPIPRAMNSDDLKMVHDAQRMFGEGRYDEASLLATAILEDVPNCVPALAVKGDCHEQMGEYREALDIYRTILTLEPESQLDLIRVNRLEKLVASGEIEVARPDGRRRAAVGAAVAAAMLLVSSGSALIIAMQKEQPTTSAYVSQNAVTSEPFMPVSPVPGAYSNYKPNVQDKPQDQSTAGINAVNDPLNTLNPVTKTGEQHNIAGGTLQDVPRAIDEPNVPITISPDKVALATKQSQNPPGVAPNSGVGRDPDPVVVDSGKKDKGDASNGSIVEIKPSKDSGNNDQKMTATERAAQIDTLIRVARDQYVQGNYKKAAEAYEKALAAGASPASTNQRLAQCYEKLGRKDDAVSAYELAIKALEQLDQNDTRVQTEIDACRSALKLLQG